VLSVNRDVTPSALIHADLGCCRVSNIQRTVAPVIDHHIGTSTVANGKHGSKWDIGAGGIMVTADIAGSGYLSSIAVSGAIDSGIHSLSGGCEKQCYGNNHYQYTMNHESPSNSFAEASFCYREMSSRYLYKVQEVADVDSKG
jgi:hypothetical protein